MAKLRIVNARTVEEWTKIIQSKWQDSTKSIIDLGLALSNAREELGAAVFGKMVRETLRYSRHTTWRLIAIGTDTRLLSVDPDQQLPASWTILYQLTKLTDEQFQRGLDTGVIHADMDRNDVALLKPPKDKPTLTGTDLIEVRAFEARQQIVASLREMSGAEQLEFISLLRFQLDDLEKARREAA